MAKMMTRRERLTRCYHLGETDRPAVYVRTYYPADDPTYDAVRAYLSERTELKGVWSADRLIAPDPVEMRREPFSEDFDRRVEILHTPAGDLRRSFFVSLKGQPGLHETHFINSPENAETYLSLPMPEIADDVADFFEADAAVGDAGIAEAHLGMNPAGYVAELCGSENFAILSATHRDLIHRLCERRMEVLLRTVRRLVERGVGPFFAMVGEEYLVPPLHGYGDFVDFNVRYDRPIIDRIHEAGGRVHVHCHGPMKQVFEGFAEMGADVVHPFESPPQGDITASEAKAIARGRFCLEGNIQIHRIYEADPEEVAEETRLLIADAFDDGRGLIVCPTASPYIRGRGADALPRIRAMVETVLKSGA